MSTPYPGSNTGYLKAADKALIQIPGLIKEMKDECRGICTEAFTDGYLTGWTNATDQFRRGDIVRVMDYLLKARGAPPTLIEDALGALRQILPEELKKPLA